MRQEVCKPHEHFRSSRGVGQSTIEPSVEDQIFVQRIGNRPEIPDCVPALEGLREMPDLSGECQLSNRMRDGQRLPKLPSAQIALGLLSKNPVRIDVKSECILS